MQEDRDVILRFSSWVVERRMPIEVGGGNPSRESEPAPELFSYRAVVLSGEPTREHRVFEWLPAACQDVRSTKFEYHFSYVG